MSNKDYFRRKMEEEERERERHRAADQVPYDPKMLETRVPLGCTLGVLTFIIGMIYLLYRHFRG